MEDAILDNWRDVRGKELLKIDSNNSISSFCQPFRNVLANDSNRRVDLFQSSRNENLHISGTKKERINIHVEGADNEIGPSELSLANTSSRVDITIISPYILEKSEYRIAQSTRDSWMESSKITEKMTLTSTSLKMKDKRQEIGLTKISAERSVNIEHILSEVNNRQIMVIGTKRRIIMEIEERKNVKIGRVREPKKSQGKSRQHKRDSSYTIPPNKSPNVNTRTAIFSFVDIVISEQQSRFLFNDMNDAEQYSNDSTSTDETSGSEEDTLTAYCSENRNITTLLHCKPSASKATEFGRELYEKCVPNVEDIELKSDEKCCNEMESRGANSQKNENMSESNTPTNYSRFDNNLEEYSEFGSFENRNEVKSNLKCKAHANEDEQLYLHGCKQAHASQSCSSSDISYISPITDKDDATRCDPIDSMHTLVSSESRSSDNESIMDKKGILLNLKAALSVLGVSSDQKIRKYPNFISEELFDRLSKIREKTSYILSRERLLESRSSIHKLDSLKCSDVQNLTDLDSDVEHNCKREKSRSTFELIDRPDALPTDQWLDDTDVDSVSETRRSISGKRMTPRNHFTMHAAHQTTLYSELSQSSFDTSVHDCSEKSSIVTIQDRSKSKQELLMGNIWLWNGQQLIPELHPTGHALSPERSSYCNVYTDSETFVKLSQIKNKLIKSGSPDPEMLANIEKLRFEPGAGDTLEEECRINFVAATFPTLKKTCGSTNMHSTHSIQLKFSNPSITTWKACSNRSASTMSSQDAVSDVGSRERDKQNEQEEKRNARKSNNAVIYATHETESDIYIKKGIRAFCQRKARRKSKALREDLQISTEENNGNMSERMSNLDDQNEKIVGFDNLNHCLQLSVDTQN